MDKEHDIQKSAPMELSLKTDEVPNICFFFKCMEESTYLMVVVMMIFKKFQVAQQLYY